MIAKKKLTVSKFTVTEVSPREFVEASLDRAKARFSALIPTAVLPCKKPDVPEDEEDEEDQED